MQHLNRMIQIAQTASRIGDLTRKKHTHVLPAEYTTTVYLHTENAALRIVRWDKRQVEATLETRPPIGWRVATDYDENGVYIVALRRTGFGTVASATIDVLVPRGAYLVLRMDDGLVSLDRVRGTLNIAPEFPNQLTVNNSITKT